jgi:hypothetical protein
MTGKIIATDIITLPRTWDVSFKTLATVLIVIGCIDCLQNDQNHPDCNE